MRGRLLWMPMVIGLALLASSGIAVAGGAGHGMSTSESWETQPGETSAGPGSYDFGSWESQEALETGALPPQIPGEAARSVPFEEFPMTEAGGVEFRIGLDDGA